MLLYLPSQLYLFGRWSFVFIWEKSGNVKSDVLGKHLLSSHSCVSTEGRGNILAAPRWLLFCSTPVKTHNLSTLHTILSTGSPLKPASFDYVYSSIKEDVLLGSISGEFLLLVLLMIFVAHTPSSRGGSRERVQGVRTPPWDEAFFFVLAFKICLPHRSVTSFLRGAPPLKKNPG